MVIVRHEPDPADHRGPDPQMRNVKPGARSGDTPPECSRQTADNIA